MTEFCVQQRRGPGPDLVEVPPSPRSTARKGSRSARPAPYGQAPVGSPQLPCLMGENGGAQPHTWASPPPPTGPAALRVTCSSQEPNSHAIAQTALPPNMDRPKPPLHPERLLPPLACPLPAQADEPKRKA